MDPPSVFNGRNCIEVCSVGSGISSATSRYYCKGHLCDQFFTKFDDTVGSVVAAKKPREHAP